MLKLAVVMLTLVASTAAFADGPTTVDLRTPQAFEKLKRDNPAHFEKIRQILAGLEEQPDRVESDWLLTNFDAHDVDLARMVVKTSLPPKQLLSFRLEQTRYTLYLVRRDMVGIFQPLE